MTQIWEWPDGLLMLIPVVFCIISWFILLCEHLSSVPSIEEVAIRFQAVYTRLVFCFPLMATVTYLSAVFPWSHPWVGFSAAIIEAYALATFYSLVLGLCFITLPHEGFKTRLLKSNWTNRVFLNCGPKFATGESALKYFNIMVFQILVFRPIPSLVQAIYFQVTNGATGSATIAVNFTMRTISVISIICCVASLFRITKFLTLLPEEPLQGHNAWWKLVTLKLLFTFIVINSIVLRPLISNGIIPVDSWICSASALAAEPDWCQDRVADVIFICQIAILVVPACLSYRHHGIEKKSHGGCHSIGFFFYYFFYVIDLFEFVTGSVVDEILGGDLTDEERKHLLKEIDA